MMADDNEMEMETDRYTGSDDDALLQICGGTFGPHELTDADVDEAAAMWARTGEPCSEELIAAAKRAIMNAATRRGDT